ncbi:GNAT family N-acetyltransferase [Hazenella sp. IB182357]|uniref:GNAT family N-acetyltransferase n=1 Tax=Polycladospora coralii TaxID=2771432 RepID=A0A926NGR4_9BACL|nr:GNAT family N-acetyltransferase [Polycladospora coralii]MBD1373038.1 GNAT family N-acetyltransferase [Polycladospora coralii]
MISIRPIQLEDATLFLAFMKQLDLETPYMLYEPNERSTSVQEVENEIIRLNETKQIFIALAQEQVIGFIMIKSGQLKRNRHTAYIVIGIRAKYHGLGLGTRLLQTAENWAIQKQIHRLELTVMTHNQVALALYQKMGFEIEGICKENLYIDGKFVDEYYMGKLLAVK